MREYRLFKILLCSLALSSGAHAQSEPTATAAQPTDREPAIRFTRPKVETPLPDGKLARGQHSIAAVWFSNPTARSAFRPVAAEDFRMIEENGQAAVAVGLNGGRSVIVGP
jgi:hypothetical protein